MADQDNTERILNDLERTEMAMLGATASDYVNLVKQYQIDSPASGHVYARRRAGVAPQRGGVWLTVPMGGRVQVRRYQVTPGNYILHRASAPGEPPAPDRGMAGGLLSQITYVVTRDSQGVVALVGTTSHPVPKYLEEGTSRMLPRPSWTPVLEQMRARPVQIQALISTDFPVADTVRR